MNPQDNEMCVFTIGGYAPENADLINAIFKTYTTEILGTYVWDTTGHQQTVVYNGTYYSIGYFQECEDSNLMALSSVNTTELPIVKLDNNGNLYRDYSDTRFVSWPTSFFTNYQDQEHTTHQFELGNKRYVMFQHNWGYYFNYGDNLTITYDATNHRFSGTNVGGYYLDVNNCPPIGNTITELKYLPVYNRYGAEGYHTNGDTWNWGYSNPMGSQYIIITNCEITDGNGNVLLPAGLKAEQVTSGIKFRNDANELVTGTYVPPSMTQQEINTATDTSEIILGPEIPDPVDENGENGLED